MSREFIFTTLQRQLEAQEISELQLATELQMTESAVKYLFTTQDCSFTVLEKICQIAGFRLEDLFGSVPREPQKLEHLTQQHEIELVSNKKLFAVAVSAMFFWSFKDILSRVKVNKTELVTLLQRLEEMGMVQVSHGNQFKLTISKKFSWIPDGPIMRMTRRESADYFAYTFEEPIDLINSFSVYLTPASHDKLKSQMIQITKEYKLAMLKEAAVPIDEKIQVSLCLAARTWLPNFLQSQMRTAAK
jgi:AraC-like DNA-binding protein